TVFGYRRLVPTLRLRVLCHALAERHKMAAITAAITFSVKIDYYTDTVYLSMCLYLLTIVQVPVFQVHMFHLLSVLGMQCFF
ncbi:hypothetical protein ACOV11_27395, partial [Vibrio natriegens]